MVIIKKKFMAIVQQTSKKWINVGCGEDLQKDMLNVDLQIPQTKKLCEFDFIQADIIDLYGTVGGGWDGIRAIYVVEHIPVDSLYTLFFNWNLCLKMGGELKIIVPSFDAIISLYQNDPISHITFRTLVYELMGGPNDKNSPDFYHHTSVWNKHWLEHYLECEGFEIISSEEGMPNTARGLGLYVHAVKTKSVGYYE